MRRPSIVQRCTTLVLLALTTSQLIESSDGGEAKPHHTIVLLGCNGDLARKYLWKGFFELYLKEREGATFIFYGAGRTSAIDGNKALSQTLGSLLCSTNNYTNCRDDAQNFQAAVQYVQLTEPGDYAHLGTKLAEDTAGRSEISRWFYLAIPPRDYGSVSELIAKFCRPSSSTMLKVIFEKPFGHDLASATTLAAKLREHLLEEEVYRVDHYLGKLSARAILPFRQMTGLDRFWSGDFIERVEIVLNEEDRVDGRFDFYDDYGVVRDVVQNHVTELLLLIAMDLPSDLSDEQQIQREKLAVLRVTEVAASKAVLTQYDGYASDLLKETGRNTSATPTFASLEVLVRSARWQRVQIKLVAGKKMPHTCKYSKVVFKPGVFGGVEYDPTTEHRNIVTFNHGCRGIISDDAGNGTGELLVIASTPVVKHASSEFRMPSLTSMESGAYTVWKAHAPRAAYDILIEEIHHNVRSSFIGTQHLLASWKVWSAMIEQTEQKFSTALKGHCGVNCKSTSNLDIHRVVAPAAADEELFHLANEGRALYSTYLGNVLHSGTAGSVIDALMNFFVMSVNAALNSSGVAHVAFSGGRSPLAFLHALCSSKKDAVMWEAVHVWLVDERCVSSDDALSNLHFLSKNLLDQVVLPYGNVHPVALDVLSDEDCARSAELYEARLRRLLPHLSFDFVLLGVGEDGHTASLFPWHPALDAYDRMVVHVPLLNISATWKPPIGRVTLTFTTISQARNVAVLVTGATKHHALVKLQQGTCAGVSDCPVLGIKTKPGALQWFIDNDALYGS